ncbi:hypothetical protein M758_UG216900 [Ceratodon purpureus]|nr:hypothetical protein M758_UG216900 [Ceratodon purpureus]
MHVDGSSGQGLCTCGRKRPCHFLPFVKKEPVKNFGMNGTPAVTVKSEIPDGLTAPLSGSERLNNNDTLKRRIHVPSNRGRMQAMREL